MSRSRIRDIKQGKIKQCSTHTKKLDLAEHAHLGLRLKAFITDTFMIAMPIMYIVIYFVFGSLVEISKDRITGWIYILIPLLIILTIFMILSKEGQTPGMKAYSLALRNIKDDKSPSGNKPSTGIIVFRQVSSLLSIPLLGWIPMFFRKDHRSLHELLSGTTLILLNEDNSSE